MFVKYNPNPEAYRTDDCVIRALTKALNMSWDEAYETLAEMKPLFWICCGCG